MKYLEDYNVGDVLMLRPNCVDRPAARTDTKMAPRFWENVSNKKSFFKLMKPVGYLQLLF